MTDSLTIIFDTDLGNCTDDAFAMQALFAYQSEGKCKVAGVMQSFKSDKCKDLIDRFMHYYKADDVPLGFVDGDEPVSFKIVPYYELVDSLKSDGTPLFPSTGISLEDRLPAWKLYRKLLSEAADESITIVCTGMFTNLGLLIDSGADEYSPLSGLELIREKVKCLHVTGGCFHPMPLRQQDPDEPTRYLEIEYNIASDVPLAKKVVENWPGTLYLFPIEEGKDFPSIHNDVLEEYGCHKDSPIYQIYTHYNEWAAGDVGQYLWDALNMLHAINGEEGFLCSDPGLISIDDDGRTTFASGSGSNGSAVTSATTSATSATSAAAKEHVVSINPETEKDLWNELDSIARFHP